MLTFTTNKNNQIYGVSLSDQAGTDPGFPVGGDANPSGGRRQHTILPDFPKNCMKLRKFWLGGTRRGRVDPPRPCTSF